MQLRNKRRPVTLLQARVFADAGVTIYERIAVWECPGVEGGGVHPHLMSSTPPLVALVYLSWGSDVTPTDRTYRHWFCDLYAFKH